MQKRDPQDQALTLPTSPVPLGNPLTTGSPPWPAGDDSLATTISRLLFWGVGLASTIVTLGGIIYLVRHGHDPVDYHTFVGEPRDLRSPVGAWRLASRGQGRGWIQVGIVVAIVTPILRVALSFFTFWRRQDWLYTGISAIVLGGLLYSFAGAYW